MSGGWVAGTVRARALAADAAGPAVAARVAESPGVAEAAVLLAGSVYARRLHGATGVAEMERAIARTLLWRLRVLAGWLPLGGVEPVRALAAWFEICAVEERLAVLSGVAQPEPFRMGRLGLVAPRLAAAGSADAVRRLLVTSAWGDPGDMRPVPLRLSLRQRWAERVIENVPACRPLAEEALVLLAAREIRAGRTPPPLPGAAHGGIEEAVSRLPAPARRLVELAATDAAGAEAEWWEHVDEKGHELVHRRIGSPEVAIGCCLLLGADAQRIVTALETAGRHREAARAVA